MSQEPSQSPLRDIPRWTETYARNRTLPGAYLMAVFGALVAGMLLFIYLGRYFRQAGQQGWMWLCLALAGLCYVGLLLAGLLQEASSSDRFEQELVHVPCSAWGDLLAALRTMGRGLVVTYAVMWFVLPTFFGFGGQALRAGDHAAAFLWYGLLMAGFVGVFVLTRARLGTRITHPWDRLGRWLSRPEGAAVAAAPIRLCWADYAMIAFFVSGVPLSSMFLVTGRIATEMMQPASAVFVVPMLIYASIRWRRHSGLLLWLYATLYALHALLIAVGAPILFEGDWQPLNMLLPVCGYGLLSALVSQAYSRYALRKLKRLSILPEPEDAEGQGGER